MELNDKQPTYNALRSFLTKNKRIKENVRIRFSNWLSYFFNNINSYKLMEVTSDFTFKLTPHLLATYTLTPDLIMFCRVQTFAGDSVPVTTGRISDTDIYQIVQPGNKVKPAPLANMFGSFNHRVLKGTE